MVLVFYGGKRWNHTMEVDSRFLLQMEHDSFLFSNAISIVNATEPTQTDSRFFLVL